MFLQGKEGEKKRNDIDYLRAAALLSRTLEITITEKLAGEENKKERERDRERIAKTRENRGAKHG